METVASGRGDDGVPSARAATLRRRLASGLIVGGAVLVAVSGFLVWLEVLGSRLSGYRLAELVTGFGDELTGVPPSWVGVAWYGIPAAAAFAWILAFRHMPPAPSRLHVVIGAGVALAAIGYLAFVDVQAGPIVAVVGGIAIGIGAALDFGRPVESSSPPGQVAPMGHRS